VSPVDPVAPQVGLAVVIVVSATCFSLVFMLRRRYSPRARARAAGRRAERQGRELWMLRAAVIVNERLIEAHGPIDLRTEFDLRTDPAPAGAPDPAPDQRAGPSPDPEPSPHAETDPGRSD
jgi:hypothetical protein